MTVPATGTGCGQPHSAAVAFFDGPRTGPSGFACHQAESSPRRPGCTIRRSGPEPPGWDYAVSGIPFPVSENRLTHFGRWRPWSVRLNRVFPHRPHSGRRLPLAVAGRSNRIECRDYSEVTAGCRALPAKQLAHKQKQAAGGRIEFSIHGQVKSQMTAKGGRHFQEHTVPDKPPRT